MRGATGAWNETRGFTGKERDDATGLADHGARYLDTRLGRWTAPDPLAVRELGGADLDVYGYVDGRVTSHHDPDGAFGQIAIGAALGGFVGGAVEGARQYYAGHFDGRALGVAVVGGAATGAMAGATCGASLATQATVMGATNAYVGTMSRVAGGQQVTAGSVAIDVAAGAAGPAVAKIAAPVVSRVVEKAAPVARHVAAKFLGTYNSLARAATNNASSAEVVLGKYNQGGVSYVAVAEQRSATYFQLKDWEKAVESVGGEQNIWHVNRAFLRQQAAAGKTFIMSHDPTQATGFFNKEVEELAGMGYRFVQDGSVWKGAK